MNATAGGTARGTPIARSLRLSLLAATMSVAVIAVLASAWGASRESKRELVDAVQSDLDKVDGIVTRFQLRSRSFADVDDQPWEPEPRRSGGVGLEQFVAENEAARTQLRVVVRDSASNEVLADSEARNGEALPSGSWLTVKAPARSTQNQLAALEEYFGQLRDCYQFHNLPVEMVTSSSTGRAEPVVRLDDRPGNRSAAEAQVLECKADAGDALNPRDPFEPVDVFIAQPAIARSVTAADGITVRSLLTILGVIALTVVITALVARKILRPIGKLTAAARTMAGGDLSQRVGLHRNDEIGQLANTFDAMAATLESSAHQRKRMTSDIAHELRTPLSNIRGYLEAAQDGVAALTPALVSSLLEDTMLLQSLVEDLQELAQAESGGLCLDQSPTDIDELAQSVAAAHRARALARGIAMEVDAAAHVTADIDARRMRQVITNLVENAIRHTDAGGQILVTTRRATTGIAIAVRDSGTGIEPEHLAHIFDRFYRTDASRNRATGGSGLGLAITRELVAAHGGTISVASVLGQGSTFTVELPAVAVGPAPAPGPALAANGAGGHYSVYSFRG